MTLQQRTLLAYAGFAPAAPAPGPPSSGTPVDKLRSTITESLEGELRGRLLAQVDAAVAYLTSATKRVSLQAVCELGGEI